MKNHPIGPGDGSFHKYGFEPYQIDMISLIRPTDLSGYKALIPSIGVGNVAQLAVDLIIATLKLERIGTGWHSALMPVFGPPAYHHDNVNKTTSLEVYANQELKLVVFQIRSPLVASLVDRFHQDLLEFLAANKFSEVIILTSSHAYEKHSVETSPFEYIANEQFKSLHKDTLDKQNWPEFTNNVLHGGGNGKKLLALCTERDIPAFLLFKYVSEGDNSPDASQLLGELNKLHKLFERDENGQVKFTTPLSWNLLFGNEPPELIF